MSFKNNFYRLQNLIIRNCFEIRRINTTDKVVYLTFDDGPEPEITELVLNELDKYGFKATFFCRGDNAAKNPNLMNQIQDEGHAIGNHTYSHLHAYNVSASTYAADVEHADEILHTKWMRPPHGSIHFTTFLKLRRKYKLVFWSLDSCDHLKDQCKIDKCIEILKMRTSPGDVVLFHFCKKHERETRELLPPYLKWLYDSGYRSAVLK